MYISEMSRHVFHSEKGSLHAGKGNRSREGLASQVRERATSEQTRDVSMKLSFKAHLRGCFLPSRCDPLCFGRIQTHLNHTAIVCHTMYVHAWWDALLTTASRGHSVQGNDSEKAGSKVVSLYISLHFGDENLTRKDNVCASQCCLSTSDQFP